MTAVKTPTELLQDSEEINRKKQAQIVQLKAELAFKQRENDKAEEIRRTIFGLADRSPEPDKTLWLIKGGKSGYRGAPMTIWSDWHFGETVYPNQVGGVNAFDHDIAVNRVNRLVSTTIDLSFNHMGRARSNYPGIVICLGGDLITGDIHDELRETNWATPQQSVNELTDILAGAIDTMAGKFGHVFLPCVVGNHGRGTMKPRMKNRIFTSFEWIIYTNLERYFKRSKHVRFYIPSETDAHFRVFGHRYLLTHGDSLGVKGGDGIIGSLGPIMRGALKVGRSESQIGRDFDTLLIGHWHQYMTPPGVIVNGALIGYSEFSRTALRARYERPTQALWFTHPEHGITASWPVYLEPKQQATDNKEWVSWQKEST